MPLARLRLAHNLPEADRHAFFDHTRCALRSRIPALQRALHCHHHAHRPGYAARPCCFAAAAAAAASGALCRCRSDPKLAYRNRRPAVAKPAAKATAVAPVHASGGRSAARNAAGAALAARKAPSRRAASFSSCIANLPFQLYASSLQMTRSFPTPAHTPPSTAKRAQMSSPLGCCSVC